MKAAVVLVCVLAFGCATTKQVHPLTKRASFDLQCPGEQLHYYELSERSYGVKGCDKQATYVESCRGGAWSEECTWVLNGMVESTAAKADADPRQ
jgi:hypothetical protein